MTPEQITNAIEEANHILENEYRNQIVEIARLRAKIRAKVGRLAYVTSRTPQETWVMMYHALFKKTKTHIVQIGGDSVNTGLAVTAENGLLLHLASIVDEALVAKSGS